MADDDWLSALHQRDGTEELELILVPSLSRAEPTATCGPINTVWVGWRNREKGQDTNNWQGNEQVKPITQSLAPTRACGGQLEMFTRKLRAEISFVFLGLIPPASRRTLSKPMEQPLCSTFDQLVLLPTRTRISNDLFGEISKLSYNY